jgi:hypothetical protein
METSVRFGTIPRLEAIRYVMMVPGREFELLSEPARQIEMMDAYLFSAPSRGNCG